MANTLKPPSTTATVPVTAMASMATENTAIASTVMANTAMVSMAMANTAMASTAITVVTANPSNQLKYQKDKWGQTL